MPAASTSRRTAPSSLGRRRRSRAVHDRVGRPKHAKERPAAAAIVSAPFDQPGISTSWTSTPPIRVSAGIGRRVVNG